jgi:hypothetical protein
MFDVFKIICRCILDECPVCRVGCQRLRQLYRIVQECYKSGQLDKVAERKRNLPQDS